MFLLYSASMALRLQILLLVLRSPIRSLKLLHPHLQFHLHPPYPLFLHLHSLLILLLHHHHHQLHLQLHLLHHYFHPRSLQFLIAIQTPAARLAARIPSSFGVAPWCSPSPTPSSTSAPSATWPSSTPPTRASRGSAPSPTQRPPSTSSPPPATAKTAQSVSCSSSVPTATLALIFLL